MPHIEIQDWCLSQDLNAKHLELPEDIFNSLDDESAIYIAEYFNNKKLIKLPEREIKFFEWLRENDVKIWNDLWLDDNVEPYIVSIAFLPFLIDRTIGFPICDLMENDNYFFTSEHIRDKEAEMFLDSIKERFRRKEQITLQQALLLRISMLPTDIWHFSYNFDIDLEAAKNAIHELVDDNMLIHLTKTEHLAAFVNI